MLLRCTSNILCKIFLQFTLACRSPGRCRNSQPCSPLHLFPFLSSRSTQLFLALMQDSSTVLNAPQGSVQGTQGCGSASCVMWARQAGCGRPSASRPLSHLLGSHLSLCSLALLFILFQVTHGLFPMASPDSQQSRALWAVISGPHHHILVTR